jgi:hypothetical protein
MHRIIGGRIACNYVGGVNGAMRELGAMIGWNIKIQGEPACPVQVALFGVMTPSGIIHRIEAQTEGTAHIRINPVSHTMTVVYA